MLNKKKGNPGTNDERRKMHHTQTNISKPKLRMAFKYGPGPGKLSPLRHRGAVLQPARGQSWLPPHPLVRRAPTRSRVEGRPQVRAQLRPYRKPFRGRWAFPKKPQCGVYHLSHTRAAGEPVYWDQLIRHPREPPSSPHNAEAPAVGLLWQWFRK